MEGKMVQTAVTGVVVLACVANLQAEGRRRVPQRLPKDRPAINWNDYNDVRIVALVDDLAAHHWYPEAIAGAQIALARHLPADQDAAVRYRMAQCCEAVPDAGPLARQTYAEVLALYPDYPPNVEIALRLGELYDHIILPGTEPNLVLAQKYYTQVVESYGRAAGAALWLPVLRAQIHLGNLHARLREYDKSNRHYEFLYACDARRLVPLPYQAFRFPGEREKYLPYLQNEAARLKEVVRGHLVSNCARPNLRASLEELDALTKKHPEDLALVEQAGKLRRKLIDHLAGFDGLLETPVQGPAPEKLP
jgi:tetratricopeptide (TPR) repeat protein